MTTNTKPTMADRLRGEIWVHGEHWAITSTGLEALNGSCVIPAEFFGPSTLASAAAVLSKDQLSEFVTMFAEALLMHGKTVVPQDVAHDFYGQHLVPAKH